MAGTKKGGIKAAATMYARYGLSVYEDIGRKGGKVSRGGGFAMNRELAAEAGRKGGSASRRGPGKESAERQQIRQNIIDQFGE